MEWAELQAAYDEAGSVVGLARRLGTTPGRARALLARSGIPIKRGGWRSPRGPIHAYWSLPGTDTIGAPLVLFHGSGGNEFDLMPLASELAPAAAKLGIRGAVAIEEGYAFFRRFPDRRLDEADIEAKAPVLAAFIDASCARCNFAGRPLAIGFSNGAIMAAALLLAHPGLLAGAILFRPLSPFTRDLPHRLGGTPVLIIDGEKDSRRSSGDGLRLADRLASAGALGPVFKVRARG